MTNTPRIPIVIEFSARRWLPGKAVGMMVSVSETDYRNEPDWIAEDVFMATNSPAMLSGRALDIRDEFTRLFEEHGMRFTTLSVGDIVWVGGVGVRVDSVGFSRVANGE